jgi:hypothetical protein
MNGKPSVSGLAQIFDDTLLHMIPRAEFRVENPSPNQQSLAFIRIEYWSVFVALVGVFVLVARPCARRWFG